MKTDYSRGLYKGNKIIHSVRINEFLLSIKSAARMLILTMTMGQFAVFCFKQEQKKTNLLTESTKL